MNRGETITVFNDLVVMAPGAFTEGDQTVSAVLALNAEHDLVDFVSDDRTRASADGTTFTPHAGRHRSQDVKT